MHLHFIIVALLFASGSSSVVFPDISVISSRAEDRLVEAEETYNDATETQSALQVSKALNLQDIQTFTAVQFTMIQTRVFFALC